MNNEEDYFKAVNIFYSFKKNYEKKLLNEKRKLQKKSVNKFDFIDRYKNFKPKCINCNGIGGTNFKITKGNYQAKCNAEVKCNFNIDIQKANFVNSKDYGIELSNEMNDIQTKIIKNKLNLIFKLDNEEVVVNEFDTLKNEYKILSEKQKLVNMYNSNLDKVVWNDYLDFYEGKTSNVETKDGERKESEKKNEIINKTVEKNKLKTLIERKIDLDTNLFKQLLNEYKNDAVRNKSKLRNALSIYIGNIRPNSEKLFNLNYDEVIIEEKTLGGGGFGKKPEIEYIFKLKKQSAENAEIKIENFIINNLDYNQKLVEKTIKSMSRRKTKVKGKNGMTLTFSSQVENHVGMKKHGEMVDGYSVDDLRRSKLRIEKMYPDSEVNLIDLREALPEEERKDADEAAVLVFKDGVNKILSGIKKTSIDLFKEHDVLKKDTTYFDTRRQKVLNKRARQNLCFAEESIAPDIANKQGTVVAFSSVPLTEYIRDALPEIFGESARNKNAEGNYYPDLNSTGIGWHGDSERRDVIGVRSGETGCCGFPIHFHWFYQSKAIGEIVKVDLTNSDIYVMSEKAVGTDWKKRNTKTLRHAAGGKDSKYLKLSKKASPIIEEKKESKEPIQQSVTGMFGLSDSSPEVSKQTKDIQAINRPDLHNNTDVFKFNKRSKDDIPGKGTAGGGETVADPTMYEELASIPNWRRALSNMYVKPNVDSNIEPLFELDGHKWASVEHWYHANKYKYKIDSNEKYKNFYLGFTLDSNSEYCKDPVKALRVGGKRGTLNNKAFRPKDIVMDPNFEEIKASVMKDGQRAKYNQDTLSKKVLLATKSAKLVHIVNRRGKKSIEIPFIDTMELRESLKNKVEISLDLNEGEKKETSSKSNLRMKPLDISLERAPMLFSQ